MRIIISEMKNILDRDNGRLGTEEERVTELKTHRNNAKWNTG